MGSVWTIWRNMQDTQIAGPSGATLDKTRFNSIASFVMLMISAGSLRESLMCWQQLKACLHCPKCGMFIGGEKARLLHEEVNTLAITSKVPMTPVEKCEVHGDQTGAEECRAALQQVPTPETPDIRLIFNPEGLSNHELEKLAQLGTRDALNKLQQALAAHEKRLDEAQQHKTGRSALVGAQKKRLVLIQQLISDCEQRMGSLQDDLGFQIQQEGEGEP